MKDKYRAVSYCGKYYCALCDYHKPTILQAAQQLLAIAEKYGSLRLILEGNKACDFDELLKGLK